MILMPHILQVFQKNNYGNFLVISIFSNQFDFDLEGQNEKL
jgi:hypothetical protein